jgi:Protein of unknown function (DUF3134)
MKNSPLREEPREKRAAVISSNHEFFLLEWLRSTGRLMERETQETEYVNEVEDISTMIEVDEIPYDLEDDDMSIDLED